MLVNDRTKRPQSKQKEKIRAGQRYWQGFVAWIKSYPKKRTIACPEQPAESSVEEAVACPEQPAESETETKVKTEQTKKPTVEEVKEQIRKQCEATIEYCTSQQEDFWECEKAIIQQVTILGRLFIQLFLVASHSRLNYGQWLSKGRYYLKKEPISRVIKTVYGPVRYWRVYLVNKRSKGGFYPLDALLGLTSDGFTPRVMSLVTKLATRVSFRTAVLFFDCFCGWAPSTESVECLVLGIGRQAAAYMEVAPPPQNEGEVLVIECDGKATPTATKEELRKRRGKRKKNKGCGCQRHRGKAKRQFRKRKRRKKGDKSKNGRSTTIVVMYTLKKGKDGKLHGPVNKKVWASYAQRKVTLAWIRRQATKRGFPPDTTKRVHIVVDGEPCLYNRLKTLFPNATFALDIRHLEEKLWDVGRLFHPEGSEELEQWVEEKRTLLYTGRAAELVLQLKGLRQTLSQRAKRDKLKYKALTKLLEYIDPRINMMNYQDLIDEDLPIASGIVEGAARYVVGERLDCSGMRWIPGRAEALLHLRCIELNGDWDHFFQWSYKRWLQELRKGKKIIVRTNDPIDLKLYTESTEIDTVQNLEDTADAA